MKKKSTYLWCAVVALTLLLGSCQKEEDEQQQDLPQEVLKEKISKLWFAKNSTDSIFDVEQGEWTVYHNHTDRYLSEQWTWEDDKLTRIEHFSSNLEEGLILKDTFLYEGNKLTYAATRFYTDNTTYEYYFIYEEDRLSEIRTKFRIAGAEDDRFLFEYTDNKITKVQVESGNFAKGQKVAFPSLISRFFMPGCSEQPVEMIEKGGTKGELLRTFYVEWNGENVSKTTRYMPDAPNTPLVTTYTYDNKQNPFYHLLTTPSSYEGILFPDMSANNVLQSAFSTATSNSVRTYTYTYQGQLPIRKVDHHTYVDTDPERPVFGDYYFTTEYEYQ